MNTYTVTLVLRNYDLTYDYTATVKAKDQDAALDLAAKAARKECAASLGRKRLPAGTSARLVEVVTA